MAADNKVVFINSAIDRNTFESKLNSDYRLYKENAIVFFNDSKVIYHNGVFYNDFMVPITYLELKFYRDNSKLLPGLKYRITDYCPDGNIPGASDKKYAGNQFDVIVTAKTTNELELVASATKHAGSSYSSEYMSKWQIHYNIENNSISWMMDENGNEAPYDFKNVLFKRYYVTAINDNSEDPNDIIEGYYATSESDKLFSSLRILYLKEEHIVADIDTSRFKWFYTFTDAVTFNSKASNDNSPNCYMNKIKAYNSDGVVYLNYVIAGDYNTIVDSGQVTICNSSHNTIKNNDTFVTDTAVLCLDSQYNNVTDVMYALIKESKHNDISLHGYVYMQAGHYNNCTGTNKATQYWLLIKNTADSQFKECNNSKFNKIENSVFSYSTNNEFSNISNSTFSNVHRLIITPESGTFYNIKAISIGKTTGNVKDDITSLLYTQDRLGLEFTQTIVSIDTDDGPWYEVRTNDKETRSYWVYI